MGHKVHPKGFRLGTVVTWPSRWFARGDAFRANLREDVGVREFFRKALKDAGVNAVRIERSRGSLTVTVEAAKPGIAIGRGGEGIEALKKKFLKEFFPGKKVQFQLNIVEVARPSLEATLVAQGVAADLERRMAFRRVLKMSLERVKKAGALGAKIMVSGRLNGAEIARREKLAWGKIPLTNLRADVDFATETARTQAGAIGVKVWIYRGDVFAQDRLSQYQPSTMSRERSGGRSMDNRGPRRDDRRGPPRMDNRGPRPESAPAAAPAPAPEAPVQA